MENLFDKVNEIIENKIRKNLNEHGGDIELLSVENFEVRVKFLGACSSCPGAQMTIEDVVESAIMEELPQIQKVTLVNGVSSDMLDFAKQILSKDK
jgi:Fe-S cluster biogenesis protein NfuA